MSTHLAQKSRLYWLQDGDRNSKFFHKLHSVSWAQAKISTVQVGDTLFSLAADIWLLVVQYYEKLFTADPLLNANYSRLDSFNWTSVSSDQNLALTAAPSLEEIWEAAFALDPNSSPGPDGFGRSFYHTCWYIISNDVHDVIHYIFTTLDLPNGLNSSFVTLFASLIFNRLLWKILFIRSSLRSLPLVLGVSLGRSFLWISLVLSLFVASTPVSLLLLRLLIILIWVGMGRWLEGGYYEIFLYSFMGFSLSSSSKDKLFR